MGDDGRSRARGVTWSRRAVVAAAALGESVAFVRLARSDDDLSGPMTLLISVAALFGLALAILVPARWVTLTRGPDDRVMTARVRRDLGWMVLASVAAGVVGAVSYPQTFRAGESHDPSWFAVVAAVALLVAPAAAILGYAVLGLLVLKPLEVVLTSIPAALRGDRGARRAVVIALVLLAVVPLAVLLALSGAPVGPGGRAGIGSLLAALLGFADADPAWLWPARGVALVLAGLLWLAVRQDRRQQTSEDQRPEG